MVSLNPKYVGRKVDGLRAQLRQGIELSHAWPSRALTIKTLCSPWFEPKAQQSVLQPHIEAPLGGLLALV